jgi:hypothetical protein
MPRDIPPPPGWPGPPGESLACVARTRSCRSSTRTPRNWLPVQMAATPSNRWPGFCNIPPPPSTTGSCVAFWSGCSPGRGRMSGCVSMLPTASGWMPRLPMTLKRWCPIPRPLHHFQLTPAQLRQAFLDGLLTPLRVMIFNRPRWVVLSGPIPEPYCPEAYHE